MMSSAESLQDACCLDLRGGCTPYCVPPAWMPFIIDLSDNTTILLERNYILFMFIHITLQFGGRMGERVLINIFEHLTPEDNVSLYPQDHSVAIHANQSLNSVHKLFSVIVNLVHFNRSIQNRLQAEKKF